MNTTAAYTPLESLLLFQSLINGTDTNAFVNISNILLNNTLVRDGDTYDAGRLSPDALHDLYSQLIQEELRSESEQDGLLDGTELGSRKRKQPSPSAPSLRDAEGYKENLPLLVDRLYARYREHMVKGIREDERRYSAIQKEIREIERGEWDDRIRQDGRLEGTRNGGPAALPPAARPAPNGSASVLPPVYPHETRPLLAPPTGFTPPLQPSPSRQHVASPRLQASPSGSPRPKATPPVSASISNSYKPPPAKAQQPPKTTPTSTPTPAASRKTNTQSPAPPPIQPAPLQHPTEFRWEAPFVPGPQHQHNPYQVNSGQPLPSPQNSPHTVPSRTSLLGPQGQYGSQTPPRSHVSANTSNPPDYGQVPPKQAQVPQSSAAGSLDALADAAGQQYRAPGLAPIVPANQSPRIFTPYPQNQRPPSSQGLSAPSQWKDGQTHRFIPVDPPTHLPFPSNPAPRPAFPPRPSPEQKQYYSPYNSNQAPPAAIRQAVSADICNTPSTPVPGSLPRHITGKGTAWTPLSSASTPRPGVMIDPPEVEPLSPVQKAASLKTTKSAKAATHQPESIKPTKVQLKRRVQRSSAGSTASSAIVGSHRSQSVASHLDDAMQIDELSMDHDMPTPYSVKQEVATPFSVDDNGETADEGPHRNLRGTPASRPAKRKRVSSFERREPAGPPTHVLWTRAFPKISASALDTISGHKNASIFAQPVKERDAPGYKDWIHRPQDLKSIRSAITAGNKAAAAAAAATTSGLDQGQSSIMLPISEDLIPPRGIINNAQLEKELERMYASAIMFNTDPNRGFGETFIISESADQKAKEGYAMDENMMVNDTKAMHADTEDVISALRSAERRSEEIGMERERESTAGRQTVDDDDDDDEVDELAGEGGAMGSVAKRRRKG